MLRCAVKIGPPNVALGLPSGAQPYQGIWDTGATSSVITAKVIADLSLAPTGRTRVRTVNGDRDSGVFLVDIELPMGVAIQSVQVTEGTVFDADVLIGMDIIGMGDFSITNVGGNTTMSFRVPSVREIDYVVEANKQVQLIGTTRPDRRAAVLAARKAQKKGRKP
jgi:hypothetical protein